MLVMKMMMNTCKMMIMMLEMMMVVVMVTAKKQWLPLHQDTGKRYEWAQVLPPLPMSRLVTLDVRPALQDGEHQ